jgi:transcriptional regulator with XRE-family HTH domain
MENNDQMSPASDRTGLGHVGRFAVCLKRIRLALQTKQSCISGAIGCSDAAVSQWESGSRVPSVHSLHRLLQALAEGGTPTAELLELRRIWLDERTYRRCRRTGFP